MKKNNPISIMTGVFETEGGSSNIAIDPLIEGLRTIGFDGVEVFQSQLDQDSKTRRRYHHALRTNKMKMACLDVICDFVSTDSHERQKAMETLYRGIELAREFNCEQILVVGSYLKEGLSACHGRKMIADGLAKHSDFARKAGVTLMIENFGMHPQLQAKAEDCLELIKQVGNNAVKFVFDTGNFVFAGQDVRANLDMLFSSTHHVHLKSWRRLADRQMEDNPVIGDFAGCPLDQGIVPNRELVRRFLERGYSRWFSLECGAMDHPLSTAARDFTILKNWEF